VQNGILQKEKTSISYHTFIIGNINAEEDLIINGKVEGNVEIKNHSFFLGPSGRLQGKVDGLNVRIRGQMNGDIKARGKVEITREAKFVGKIKCKRISVEEGAYFHADVNIG
jgi:cytoskeletal protein CcmA (bactofilin family)